MKWCGVAVAGLGLVLGACADRAPVTGVRDAGGLEPGTRGPSFAFVEGQYPTQEEYLGAGGSMTGEATGSTPTGWFSGTNNTSWSSTASLAFQYVNQADASLTTSVISDAGQTINSGADTYHYGSTIPAFSRITKTFQSIISTANNSCGITGRARLTGTASLRLIQNPTNITLVWSGNIDKSALDVTLPACPEKEEDELEDDEVYVCDGMIVDDPTNCENPGEGGGSPGGGGGSGGGGGAHYCELWEIITYESRDGGNSWSEVGRRYEYRNCY